jgi:tetraacyldisaccharide 4'-kinase
LQTLLLPFAEIYKTVMAVRNHLYNTGLKPSVTFDIPVIGVGNLAVGGTGKTPMVQYLVTLLHTNYKVATLSRGYGRETKGFRMADDSDTAATIGDEPLQLYAKNKEFLKVCVGEERALAIPLLLQESPEVQAIVLDDAFQHRKVKPSLNILITDYSRPFFKDYVLPAGLLRESRTGASRADIIVVSKCPLDATEDELNSVLRGIRAYSSKPVFFTGIKYEQPIMYKHGNASLSNNVIIVSGIANAKPLLEYASKSFNLLEHIEFNDHHEYSKNDALRIKKAIEKHNAVVVTTEKDKGKLDTPEFANIFRNFPFFYLPISVQFLKDGDGFDRLILNHVANAV